MASSRSALLQWQLDSTWSLVEFNLGQLRPDDHLWEPTTRCCTVRRDGDGRWMPDWHEPEPDPPPVPMIAWLTWHIGWWWSVTLDHQNGRSPRDRSEIAWPGSGDAAVAWLHSLRREWRTVLNRLTDVELDAIAPFPWHDTEHSCAQMIGWVNAELMKNGAEIGQLRMLRRAEMP